MICRKPKNYRKSLKNFKLKEYNKHLDTFYKHRVHYLIVIPHFWNPLNQKYKMKDSPPLLLFYVGGHGVWAKMGMGFLGEEEFKDLVLY